MISLVGRAKRKNIFKKQGGTAVSILEIVLERLLSNFSVRTILFLLKKVKHNKKQYDKKFNNYNVLSHNSSTGNHQLYLNSSEN